MGGTLTLLILITFGWLTLTKLDLVVLFFPYAILCLITVLYYQWKDDNLNTIYTGLPKEKNIDLVAKCLKDLNWHYTKNSTQIDLTLNKYILKFLNPTIILDDEVIYYNFKYHSTSSTGRFPFFFGISSYLEWTFKKAVKKHFLTNELITNNYKEPKPNTT